MFNNDLTKNYNQQDATSEIVIMLLGAFLLGCLMCWLIKKLFSKNTDELHQTSNHGYENNKQSLTATNHKQENTKYKPQTTGEVRVIKNAETTYSTPKIDDLTKISGITPEIQTILKQQGINSYTDLRDIKKQSLQSIQEKFINERVKRKEVETWPHQSSLAAKGEWNKLKEYQAFISRSHQASSRINEQINPESSDDLKMIEGIGPKIEEVLHAKGIHTFKQLSNADTVELKKYIVESDERFSKNETESWPHQAAMAEKGQWEELNIYQEFMHSETIIDTENNEDNTETPAQTEIYKENINESSLKDYDDLKRIDGISPEIEEILNKSGIYTYSQLQNSNEERLKLIINDARLQYNVENIETWSNQAGMANRQEWQALKDYQKLLPTNKVTSDEIDADSRKENTSDNSSDIVKDDLKKIEGIGPKIQELLANAGIHTFKELAEHKRDYLKSLLDAGGPQYRVHEPESWPQQAKLASEGKWEELQTLQDELIGGRK